ncbi:hypothetical protein ACE939_03035 [Aquimarina sp. W85]|uniref:hypothetical protein n=1 Tax=Aquimarina rhodophyticola TaxID=3342246 RepID=UPI00366F26C1
MKLKNLILILIMTSIAFSCSNDSDEDTNGATIQGDLKIENIKATLVSYSFEGTLSGISSSDYKLGLRKEGEDTFEEIFLTTSIQFLYDLTPAQRYELAIIKDGKVYDNKSIKFSTLPFNTIEDLNSKIKPDGHYFYSERGFTHKLKSDVLNKDANIKFFFVEENGDSSLALSHNFVDGTINFTVPEDAVSNEPYEEYKIYHLAYQLGDTEIVKINKEDSDVSLTFYVFNPTPIITQVNSITTENCLGNKTYALSFKGHFFSSWPFEEQVYYNYKNSTAIITRDDDNTEIMLEKERLDCIEYNKFFSKEEASISFSLVKLHTDKTIYIRHPETTIENNKFTSGNYKIRITFNNGADDFKETNTFPFTLP